MIDLDDDQQLLKYSRQIMLPKFGIESQIKLAESHVAIIGLGGLGSPVAIYLAAAGIGYLHLVDFDKVEITNLQRQIAHGLNDIGTAKVLSAQHQIEAINPDVVVHAYSSKLSPDELHQLAADVDVIVDATDNFESRYAINAACVATQTPLISGAAIRFEGQVSVFCNHQNSPCYHCLYKEGVTQQETCAENGILAPVVGIIGCTQALETIKVLTQLGEPLDGRLLLFDGLAMQWRQIKLKKDPQCPVCSNAQ